MELNYKANITGANQAVLFIHGWRSSLRASKDYMEGLKTIGYDSLAVELRGHGDSDGDLDSSRADFLSDVIWAYDKLRSLTPARITVIGSSFGAYLAAILTSQRAVDRLILRVPADYPDRGFDEPPAIAGSRDPDHYSSTRALRSVAEFSGPMLLVESGDDEVIPEWMIENYLEAGDMDHIVMKKAPHTISTEPRFKAEYLEILKSWLKETEAQNL